MVINIDDSSPEKTISLPADLSEICGLPEDLPYEIIVDDTCITIGPIIAMIAYRDKKKMSCGALDKLKLRFSHYKRIKGLIFVCAANCIIPNENTIEGYYFNPNGTTSKTRWKYGMFPYPNAVYKRVPIESSSYNHLISKVGDRVINSVFFLKADIVHEAEKDELFTSYFPHTEIVKNEKQIRALITRFQSVYIKPSNGSQGEGIYKITIDKNNRIKLIDRENKTTVISNKSVLLDYLREWRKKEYIIQKAIKPIGNQNIDFRVYVQKNGLQNWVCQGMIGRVANQGTIITNLKYVDKILDGHTTIKKFFRVDSQKAKDLEEEIYTRCIGVCKEIDKRFGTYGDVAVDVIVDSNLNVWILEINKVYGYNSIVKMKNKTLLETLFTTPFDYAKALAGF
ncbi:YheC/YheD family endospore coat-associated protein [Metabacillus halosaccharovorans]|uniref:YheC/YheD family protein n=1 Tax=Metabacillus halosaccharovorans TaxID=930124 RepID=A0ABT3DL78_9BACI|nr:YheC/YheD family protein [Metabacillus halosaccharovorans]MCV9887820.1 YheC/YheD family protein [Metabacillus halosaccharovorans]